MKTPQILSCLSLLLLGLAPARAVMVETHNFNALNLDIPDGNPSGLANVQNFATGIGFITDLEVALTIAATPDGEPIAFNGDLYAYLQHGSGLSVLLNRVGRAIGSPFGYDDNGFVVTFDDSAANGDVHVYRDVTTPAPGNPLTGIWLPDARITDPNLVLNTDPRSPTAMLATFNTLSAAGDWTLFVADLSTGEEHRLASWALTITGEAIPEPAAAVLVALGVAAFGGCTRRRSECRAKSFTK